MDRVEAAVWHDRLLSAATPDRLAERIVDASKFRVIIPSDPDWPAALNDLGPRAPYTLWAKGRTELLTEPLPQRITVTGARADTAYGAHVTDELCGDLAQDGRTLVAGAAYGIEASAHRAALIRDANTIAVLASGGDRASSPLCRARRSSLKQDPGQVRCTRPPRRRSWDASSAQSPGR